MMKIVSIQSSVAYGHVGNSAAVFPLQRMGFEVWPVPTVQFSNHPGHGTWRGKVLSPELVRELVHGLEEVGAFDQCDGVLTGYLGDADIGEAALLAVERARAGRQGGLYLCDPVMGDDGPGLYVRPGIPEFLAARAVPMADIVTPNRFELEVLAGIPVPDLTAAVQAARLVLAKGPRMVVVTSLRQGDDVACLLVTSEAAWQVRTPFLAMEPAANGAGDMLAALFLGHLLRGHEGPEALSLAVSSLFGVLRRTQEAGRRELAMVAAQDELALPTHLFPPQDA